MRNTVESDSQQWSSWSADADHIQGPWCPSRKALSPHCGWMLVSRALSIRLWCGLDCNFYVLIRSVIRCLMLWGLFCAVVLSSLNAVWKINALPDKASLSRTLTALNNLHRDHFDHSLLRNMYSWEIHFRNTVQKYSLEIQLRYTVAKYIVKPLSALIKFASGSFWSPFVLEYTFEIQFRNAVEKYIWDKQLRNTLSNHWPHSPSCTRIILITVCLGIQFRNTV